jgi:hypothetical protein
MGTLFPHFPAKESSDETETRATKKKQQGSSITRTLTPGSISRICMRMQVQFRGPGVVALKCYSLGVGENPRTAPHHRALRDKAG